MTPDTARNFHDRTWADFIEQPVSFVHPANLAACFEGSGLESQDFYLMAREPRFHERLRRMLERRFDICLPLDLSVPSDVGGAEVPLLNLDDLARECGAIYWSEAFIQEVRASAVRAQSERFGEHLQTLALVHHDLAGNEPVPADLDALELAVDEAGGACVQAWLAEQPKSVMAWLKLMVSPARICSAPRLEISELGPSIMRRVLASRTLRDHLAEAT